MIVLITGMFRSGSTWSFNVVKHLLSNRFGASQIRTAAGDDAKGFLTEDVDGSASILKGHYLDDYASQLVKDRNAYIIHTFRDPSDAICSGKRAFSAIPPEDSMNMVVASFDWMDLIMDAGHGCMIFYNDIEDHPKSLIQNIGTYLGLRVEDDEAAALAGQLHRDSIRMFTDKLRENSASFEAEGRIVNIGFSYYDELTFFHRSHIAPSDQVYASLSGPELSQLLARTGRWLDSNGRLIIRESQFR